MNTLKGSGPFKVLTPTDAAVAKGPKANLHALLADEAALTKLLACHGVPGKVMS